MTENMLFVTYEEYPSFIGTTTRVRGIARALKKKGHRVEIVAPCYAGKSRSEEHLQDGLLVHRIRMPFLFGRMKVPMLSMAVFIVLFAVRARLYFRKSHDNFSFILAEQAHSFPCASLLAKKFLSRIVIDDPDDLVFVIQEKIGRLRLLFRIVKTMALYFEKRAFKSALLILYSSPAIRKAIVDNHGVNEEKLCFLTNGIDPDEYPKPSGRASGSRLFFNCSLPYYQNTAALENIAHILRYFREQGFTGYELTLVVNNASLVSEHIRKEMDLSGCVRMLSAVPSLIPYIMESDVVLLPFQKGHRSTAGPRLKALEAFACGKVVMTTPEGIDGIDGCEDGKNVILCSDAQHMAKKCMQLLKDSNDAALKIIEKNARRLVKEKYSWDILVSSCDRKLFLRMQEFGYGKNQLKYRVLWFIGRIASFFIYYTGTLSVYLFFRRKILHRHRSVILMYHRVNSGIDDPDMSVRPETFEKQMTWISAAYRILSLGEIVDLSTQGAPLTEDCVSLTFDDGFRDNYDNAFPILRKLGLPAAIFIATGRTGRDKEFMTPDEISEMSRNGITIGAHTVSHPVLSKISPQKAEEEIISSKKSLDSLLQRETEFFAYPYGKNQDFNEDVKAAVRRAGFKAALSTENGTIEQAEDLYALERIGIRETPLWVFKVRVSGFYESAPLLYIRKMLGIT